MNVVPDPPPPPAAAGTPQAAPGPLPPPAASGQPARLALFRLGGRLCGITAAFCKQFIQLEAVTPVPLAPAHLLGVTQLRGRILPVLDVTLLPGLPQPPAPPEAPVLPELSETTPPDTAPAFPARPAKSGQPPAPSGMPALVVTATGLDSTLAALKVTEIVGFERPASAASSPLWRGEEVAVLDVFTLLGSLRPGPHDVTPGQREGAPAVSGGVRSHEQEPRIPINEQEP